jgi:ubiquinone/menaquinone biosynthesis C-methylase UbiE
MVNLPGAFFIGQLWWYSAAVLRPAQVMRSLGWYPENTIGCLPHPTSRRGAGRLYSLKHRRPVLLSRKPRGYELVEEFDGMSEIYTTAVEPFSRPVFEETIRVISPYLTPQSRILDPSCGPGLELCQLGALVTEGEIVGTDLAEKMVLQAFDNTRRQGLDNGAFFQADVGDLPKHFEARFDLIFCSLSFHHYTAPLRALLEMRRVLRRGGHAVIVDAGPAWMKALGSPMAKLADPGWVAFRTGEEFQQLCQEAGFSGFYWTEVLPGMGLTLATR